MKNHVMFLSHDSTVNPPLMHDWERSYGQTRNRTLMITSVNDLLFFERQNANKLAFICCFVKWFVDVLFSATKC